MAVKHEKELTGFDPLAWMDEESNESEEIEAPEKKTKTDIVEDNQQSITEEVEIEEESIETKLVETELSADEPVIEQSEQSEQVVEDAKITLDATLNIQNVSKLYEQIQTLLNNQEQIEIDASSVISVDTATLQLLIVLKQTAIKLHKEIVIDFPSDNFVEAAELLGLSEMLGVDQSAAGFF